MLVLWTTFASPASALTCDEIFKMTSTGVPEAEVVASIKAGLDMTLADLGCLTAGGAPRAIQEAAKQRVARSATPAPAPVAPRSPSAGPRVDIEFVGAVFAPRKGDGSSWDLDGATAGAVGTAVAVGAAGVGVPGLGALGQASMAGLAQPDPAGWVQLAAARPGDQGPLYRRVALKSGQDTLRPTFESPPKYRGWPLNPELAFRVHLWDDDPGQGDDVPIVDIGYAALREALAAPGVYAVPVARQSAGLVEAVLVRVRPSSVSEVRVEGLSAP